MPPRNDGFAPVALLVLLVLALLPAACHAAASNLYGALNGLRAGAGGCNAAARLRPLKPQAALERAAGELARGNKLETALTEVGYRATRSKALHIRGEGVGANAAEVLAEQSYCAILQDGAMTEVGIHVEPGQLWLVMAAPFAPSVRLSERSAGLRVLELVNQARATPRYCGRSAFGAAPPLRWNDSLAEASRVHAEDMAHRNYFSHRGSDGSSPAQRIERAGYRYRAMGENLAGGQLQPEDAVAGWIKSPEHCANLMNPAFTEMGSAYAVDPGSEMGVYWAQAFGRPR
jgi:uncharacterized protein YkwD